MALPSFESSIDPGIRAQVEEKLLEIEGDHEVRVLFAVESGSRAWGFPSPDSDYDVRFVYVHALDWYLSLAPGRDVIELPISDELDIAGWDLRKALNLLLKPNPVMLEWLSSPVHYRWQDETCAALSALAERTAPAAACLYHYLHLGETQWMRHVAQADTIKYKKYFYVLRPALAIRWVRLHPDVPPPMNIQAMSEGLALEPGIIDDISTLLAKKREARETALGPRFVRLDALIEQEFEWARTAHPGKRKKADLAQDAERLFRHLVKQA